MKKVFLSIILTLALGTTAEVAAQQHRHTPRTVQVDTTAQQQPDALEAFSDTTSAVSSADTIYRPASVTIDAGQITRTVFDSLDGNDILGLVLIGCFLVFMFLLVPICIIAVIFYFIRKNRRDKLRLAEMAMKNGQPIPEELLKDEVKTDEDISYQAGMRQLFLGIGLMFFLGYAAGEVGFGIGALIFFIGLGKIIIAKTAGKKNDIDNHYNNPSEI